MEDTGKLEITSDFWQHKGWVEGLVESAVDGIIVIDEDATIGYANAAALRLFGYSEEEVIGNNVSMLMPEPYSNMHDRYLANYRDTEEKKVIGIGREVSGSAKTAACFLCNSRSARRA